MTDISPYNVLDIHRNCTIDEVKNKFKKLAVQYHPDKGGDKNIFNLLVHSFKQIVKDINDKNSDKDFQTLKTEYKHSNNTDNNYVVANEEFHDKFNKYFNENKTVDINFERGYNNFINEPEIKTSQKHYKLKIYKEPEGNILSKLQFEELGTTIKDYSGKNDDIHKLQYMDYQYAHTTSKLIDPDMVKHRNEFKSLNDIKQKRSSENFSLTNEERTFYEKLSLMKDRKEQKRIAKLQKFDKYLDKHNSSLSQLSIQ